MGSDLSRGLGSAFQGLMMGRQMQREAEDRQMQQEQMQRQAAMQERDMKLREDEAKRREAEYLFNIGKMGEELYVLMRNRRDADELRDFTFENFNLSPAVHAFEMDRRLQEERMASERAGQASAYASAERSRQDTERLKVQTERERLAAEWDPVFFDQQAAQGQLNLITTIGASNLTPTAKEVGAESYVRSRGDEDPFGTVMGIFQQPALTPEQARLKFTTAADAITVAEAKARETFGAGSDGHKEAAAALYNTMLAETAEYADIPISELGPLAKPSDVAVTDTTGDTLRSLVEVLSERAVSARSMETSRGELTDEGLTILSDVDAQLKILQEALTGDLFPGAVSDTGGEHVVTDEEIAEAPPEEKDILLELKKRLGRNPTDSEAERALSGEALPKPESNTQASGGFGLGDVLKWTSPVYGGIAALKGDK